MFTKNNSLNFADVIAGKLCSLALRPASVNRLQNEKTSSAYRMEKSQNVA
ncbi:hypothetical protein AB28_4947 [Raoultella ornithinolytica 2-156-04_S1_C2]|nr:hypothetical protein AB00_4724 [Raoultella ornithinolytica 2-156-04_S1_C1]KDX09848.1 hypothetical protein AB28_4947 [Raoultella ornithinolytica 2-156-04_S1_C2]